MSIYPKHIFNNELKIENATVIKYGCFQESEKIWSVYCAGNLLYLISFEPTEYEVKEWVVRSILEGLNSIKPQYHVHKTEDKQPTPDQWRSVINKRELGLYCNTLQPDPLDTRTEPAFEGVFKSIASDYNIFIHIEPDGSCHS